MDRFRVKTKTLVETPGIGWVRARAHDIGAVLRTFRDLPILVDIFKAAQHVGGQVLKHEQHKYRHIGWTYVWCCCP